MLRVHTHMRINILREIGIFSPEHQRDLIFFIVLAALDLKRAAGDRAALGII